MDSAQGATRSQMGRVHVLRMLLSVSHARENHSGLNVLKSVTCIGSWTNACRTGCSEAVHVHGCSWVDRGNRPCIVPCWSMHCKEAPTTGQIVTSNNNCGRRFAARMSGPRTMSRDPIQASWPAWPAASLLSVDAARKFRQTQQDRESICSVLAL